MDVLWFRLSRRPDDPEDPVGRFDSGTVFVMLNRDTYWQCGFVIPKGSHAQVRERGLAVLRHSIAELAPFIADRVGELQDWEAIKLLTVQVDRLDQWYRQGLICIGDAAHAMSPLGGVGINLAIQDAVAASNLLAAPLREDRLTIGDLRQVQQRRTWPTQMTQRLQVFLQNRIISRVLHGTGPLSPPFFLQLLAHFPFLRAIPARLIGIGFRPEHVNTRSVWPE
jgi:2-polyprenyl-6-methoxyphenol hydroxylase-like FAD-dependent oxidoreductase